MRRLVYLIILLANCLYAIAGEGHYFKKATHEKKINFGIKGGFTSSMFLVDRFKIKDITIDEVQNNYKVGYWGAFFMRINMKKHFLQPEIIYNVSKGEIEFDKRGSQHPDIDPDYATIISTIHSVEVPLLYGYNLIKSGPYGMNLFAGPKVRYVWKEKSKLEFTNFDQKGISEELYPLNISAVIGLGVSISNIFFDFRYEIGLHNISKEVFYDNISESGNEQLSNIVFRRRSNLLSFSFGFIF